MVTGVLNMNWAVPKGDKVTVRDIKLEWNNKGNFVIDLCKNKNRVVQAGGNLGIFPYHLSRYFDEVITFEPIKKNYTCLLENIKSKNNIIVHRLALGDKSGCARIQLEKPGNCGAIRLEYTEVISDIQVVQLDSYNLSNLDLLWLDIEGFEVKALMGAYNNIHYFKPVIVIENNGLIHEFPSDKEGSQDFRDWMKKVFNYKFYKRMMRDDIFIPI